MSITMPKLAKTGILAGSLSVFMLSFFVALMPWCPSSYTYAQYGGKVRTIQAEFIPESGVPVKVNGVRTELDLDPFDTPLDARIYIDYQNISDRAISAVKFRLRLTDAEGKDRGTFHAPHGAMLGPGQSATEKFKHEKVDPRTSSIKVRVLQVRFADGGGWQSAKMSELAVPAGGADGPPQAAAPPQAPPEQQPQQPAQPQGGGATLPW